ncbi:MAG: UDP-N-acetylmuramate dehydrogenase [Thermodesulfovibrionales bacterium]|nr:UDP-N-acetylmuramate dehydrogenase [Thermodesulfovibrionales bacterium]
MTKAVLHKEDRELKDIFSRDAFRGRAMFGEPMRRHTSLKIGGPADIVAFPSDIPALRHAVNAARESGIPVFPLGGGTNVLVGDAGIRGIVISLSAFKGMAIEDKNSGEITITADAGLPLQRLVALSKKKGLSGIEALSGIPGTLGGAVAGNAGAYGTEIKDVLAELTLLAGEGDVKAVDAKDIAFGYRCGSIPSGSIILAASLKLKKDDPMTVAKKIVDFLKMKKETQPLAARSAGCVFKNPPGASAGKLMEEAGLKGRRLGDVEVSRVHANFFITRSIRAKADDFLKLMDIAALKVRESSGLILEPEIRIIGC